MTHVNCIPRRSIRRVGQRVVWAMLIATAATANVKADEAARKAYDAVKEGNRLLGEEKFSDALKAYDEASRHAPQSPQVAYNRGLALYRLGQFEEARTAFQDAVKPSHPEIEAMAKYNLGRTAHAEAMEHAGDPKQAIEDLSRAINFYQDALRTAPTKTDPDAQKNLALAERLRNYFQKRLEQQQPPQQQPSSQPSSQPQDRQPQPTTSRSQTSQPGSQPTSGESQSNDESEKNEQESREGSDGQKQEQNQDGEQDESQSQNESDQKDSQSQKQSGADGKEGADQASGEQNEKQDEKDASAGSEQKADRDDKLREEEIQPMLQEARDAEKARREARRMKMMRQRGRTAVPKDW